MTLAYHERPVTDFTDEDLALLKQFRQAAGRAIADATFTVAQAAAAMGMSERTLYRKFLELTGKTPAAYLREFRLDHARELLETGAVRSVEAAAFAVGIEDVAYFARIFYKYYKRRASDLVQP